MSKRVWFGAAQSVRQVNTITPVAANAATYTITINGKSVTYTSDASATVPEITAGLQAAFAASTEGEFQELTAVDKTTYLELTGPEDGTPFTQTSSASAGSLTTATATAATGPHDWNNAKNWSGAAVPVDADDPVVDESSGAPEILDGIDQSTVTFASFNHTAGKIGRPAKNPAGYAEYRQQFLKVEGITTAATVGGASAGPGVSRLRLDANGTAVTLNVLSTATPDPADNAAQAVQVKNLASTSAVNIISGSVGLNVGAGEVNTVATLRVGGGTAGAAATVVGGAGLTLTTLQQFSGDVTLANGGTTLGLNGGTLTVTGGTVTTANVDAGTLYYQSTGTLTTLNVGNGGTADFSRDIRARTVTNCTLQADAALIDTARSATFTNGIVLNRCSVEDVALKLGTHLTLTIAAGP
jgi:hypothetical protein